MSFSDTYQRAIDDNFGKDPNCFVWQRPSLPQLQHQFADGLAKDLDAIGGHWEYLKAHPAIAKDIPEEPGLYMFVWSYFLRLNCGVERPTERFPVVLYVGQAGGGELASSRGTLRSRFVSEYRRLLEDNPSGLWATKPARDRNGRLSAGLSLRPLEYWWLSVARTKSDQLMSLEKRLVVLYDPPLNSELRFRPRTTTPRKAF